MARQKGIIKLNGAIGDISFYKTKDGYMAREKAGVSADRIANDPNYLRTRENGQEFGRAGKAGKLLRQALRGLLQNVADRKMSNRLLKAMMRVLHEDRTNPRGMRNVIDGEAELLAGFDFNQHALLHNLLLAPFTKGIDRATGTMQVTFPSFFVIDKIIAPKGATHFVIHSAGCAIDFEGESYESDVKSSDTIALAAVQSGPVSLQPSVAANSAHPLFLALGIEFFQEVNGQKYALNHGEFNALSLVAVSG